MSWFRPAPPADAATEEENPYLLSFADIMAGLLAIFILALIALMIRLDQQAEMAQDVRQKVEAALSELARMEALRKELLEEVKQRLELEKIRVEISENYSVLRIPEEELHFAPGSYEIPENKSAALDLIGEVLAEALHRSKRLDFIDTIFIEGHTDSQPLHSSDMGNWGLSAYRAVAVWKHWTESPGHLRTFILMKNRHKKPLFSVSGYADTRRIVVPDFTPEERRQNRRIDLRFTMYTPVTGDLNQLLKKFQAAGISE